MKSYYTPVTKDNQKALINKKWVEYDFISTELIETKYYKYIGKCTKVQRETSKGLEISNKRGFVYKFKPIIPFG